MMSKKDKQRKKRTVANDPIAIWINSEESGALLCPKGYVPLAKNEEVRKCVHKIADMVSSMTIMLMENGEFGDIRLKNELSKKVDVYPNHYMGRKNFIYKIVSDMLITGNGVVYPEIKDGLIENLLIWDINKAFFDCTEGAYSIRYNGIKFEAGELLHFVLVPDDEYPMRGQGFGLTLKNTLANILQAEATKTGFLQSKWKPSLIISINSDAGELQDEEQRRNILGSYTKTTEIGEPWLIPAGEIDVKTVQPLTLNDLAIQESITLDKRVVAATFGVPGFMVGVGTFNKDEYNNFVATTVMPIARIIEQELTKKLVYRPNWYFKFNPKSLMQYNLSEQISFVKEMMAGGMLTRNEGRSEFDYSPVNNAGMNDYIVLENYVPVEKVGDQKKLKGGDEVE